jgi:hypothetical protein
MWPALALLHDHVRQFRVLDIDVHTADIADTILSSIALSNGESKSNPAPLLEVLRITISTDSILIDEKQSYFEHAFYPAPQLRRLTLSAWRPPPPPSKLLSTVTSLTIICA